MKLRRKRSSASFPFLEEWFLSCLLLDTRCANSEPGHKPLEGPTCGTVIFTHLLAWPFRIHVDSMIWLLIVLEVNRYYILWHTILEEVEGLDTPHFSSLCQHNLFFFVVRLWKQQLLEWSLKPPWDALDTSLLLMSWQMEREWQTVPWWHPA